LSGTEIVAQEDFVSNESGGGCLKIELVSRQSSIYFNFADFVETQKGVTRPMGLHVKSSKQ
jgi:hypothetical protein